ncbi:MAG: hypothetical protein PHS02_00600 [Candidatus ainarchaeum sp.]|nr:hypothetical protein [Candidatus ainarchaeum sp.]
MGSDDSESKSSMQDLGKALNSLRTNLFGLSLPASNLGESTKKSLWDKWFANLPDSWKEQFAEKTGLSTSDDLWRLANAGNREQNRLLLADSEDRYAFKMRKENFSKSQNSSFLADLPSLPFLSEKEMKSVLGEWLQNTSQKDVHDILGVNPPYDLDEILNKLKNNDPYIWNSMMEFINNSSAPGTSTRKIVFEYNKPNSEDYLYCTLLLSGEINASYRKFLEEKNVLGDGNPRLFSEFMKRYAPARNIPVFAAYKENGVMCYLGNNGENPALGSRNIPQGGVFQKALEIYLRIQENGSREIVPTKSLAKEKQKLRN